MAKKKEISKEVSDLKKEVAEGRVAIGTKVVLANLKARKLSKVYLASNCQEKVKKDIGYYSDLAKMPVVVLELNNEEIGILCKKHFFISVLGLKKK